MSVFTTHEPRMYNNFREGEKLNGSADSASKQQGTKNKKKALDIDQVNSTQRNETDLRQRRKTTRTSIVDEISSPPYSLTDNSEIPSDPLLFKAPFNIPSRNSLSSIHTSPLMAVGVVHDDRLEDEDSRDGDQGREYVNTNTFSESGTEAIAPPMSKQRNSIRKQPPRKINQTEKDEHTPLTSSLLSKFPRPPGSKCTNDCYRDPNKCKHRNKGPALQTKNAIIYDLPAYMRRVRILQANPDNRQIFGPEHGPPATSEYSQVRILGPEEMPSVSLESAQRFATLTLWLVENIPKICPEWNVRHGPFTKWKLTAREFVWEMNQKWKVDVPAHQVYSALKTLRDGLEQEDGEAVDQEEEGSRESERRSETMSRRSNELRGENDEAARLMASFTAPLRRKRPPRRRRRTRGSTSLWAVEDAEWGSEDEEEAHLDKDETVDVHEEHKSQPSDKDADLDMEEDDLAIYESVNADEEAIYEAGDDYDTALVHGNHNEDPKEDSLDRSLSLLRTYLHLGLTNTKPPPPPPHQNFRSTALLKSSRTEQTRVLERGISEMRNSGFGPDEEVLRFAIESALASR